MKNVLSKSLERVKMLPKVRIEVKTRITFKELMK
jgi:hypothetical protein